MPYAELGDPQTLNLYAYGRNNPVTLADADGHTPLDWIWEQSGYMDQQVGFGFHLWDGVQEGMGRIALGVAPGAVVMVLTRAPTTVDVVAAFSDAVAPVAALYIDGMLLAYDVHELRLLAQAYGFEIGGGKNAPKVNPDRKEAARDRIEATKKELARLKSQPMKTPKDKDEIERLQREIKRQTDRMRTSEEHSRGNKR